MFASFNGSIIVFVLCSVPIQYIPPSRVTHSSSNEDIQKLTDETGEAKAYQDVSLSSLLSLLLLCQFQSTALFFFAM
jgi:hypothetical protein